MFVVRRSIWKCSEEESEKVEREDWRGERSGMEMALFFLFAL